MPYLRIRSFQKTLLPSRIAARLLGPARDPARFERIDGAEHQGIVGSNNRKVNLVVNRECNHASDVCRGNVHTGRIPRYPAVARQCVQRGDVRVLG